VSCWGWGGVELFHFRLKTSVIDIKIPQTKKGAKEIFQKKKKKKKKKKMINVGVFTRC
jgi:hypothetical protein